MMPEAGAVIEAARRFLAGPLDGSDGAVAAMEEALAALDAKLLTIGAAPSKVEQDRTWGEVVAGDEILSAKTGKFYEVHTSVRTPDGKMKIMINGAPKPVLRDAKESIRIKRGVEGESVDILEVLFSGQTRPTMIPAGKAIGPMIKTKEEEEESDGDE